MNGNACMPRCWSEHVSWPFGQTCRTILQATDQPNFGLKLKFLHHFQNQGREIFHRNNYCFSMQLFSCYVNNINVLCSLVERQSNTRDQNIIY